MARPQRNNVDYFPFYCNEGKKMFYLEETYGNDGFAVFVKILRELAKTDYHYLNLSKNTTLMFLSAKCKVKKEVLELIINDIVELNKFDRILWEENKIIWCQDFIDSIQDAYNKRNNNCITYEGLLDLLISLGIRKQGKCKSKGDVNTQSKVKYSKENKYIYNKFYDEEIKRSNNNINYISFVKFLFGNNEINKPLNKVINLDNQITYEKLNELLREYTTLKIKDTILSMQNYTKKSYSSFSITLKKWLDNEIKR